MNSLNLKSMLEKTFVLKNLKEDLTLACYYGLGKRFFFTDMPNKRKKYGIIL